MEGQCGLGTGKGVTPTFGLMQLDWAPWAGHFQPWTVWVLLAIGTYVSCEILEHLALLSSEEITDWSLFKRTWASSRLPLKWRMNLVVWVSNKDWIQPHVLCWLGWWSLTHRPLTWQCAPRISSLCCVPSFIWAFYQAPVWTVTTATWSQNLFSSSCTKNAID